MLLSPFKRPKKCLAVVLSVLSDGNSHLFVLVHRNPITLKQIFPFQCLKREFGLLSCMSVVIYTLLFVLFFFYKCSWHVIQASLCFKWVSWPKSDVGDFDSLSRLLRNKEFWSFSSSHQTLVAFMIAGTYQRESLHWSLCNSSMFQSIHRANQWNGRLWSGESMKWRALHYSTYVIVLHHTLYLSFLTWFPFLSHSVFFSFHVLLSCFSLWTLERLYSFYIFNQGQQSHCKVV